MFALIRYHISYYIKSSKFVMPLLAYFIFLTISYSAGPVSIAKIIVSACALYLDMVWVGFAYGDVENPISEQIIMLKCGNMKAYYRSKIIFLFLFSFFMSFIGLLIPSLRDLIGKFGKGNVFHLSLASGLEFYVIHVVAAFLGAMVGYFFQPRVFKNRMLIVIVAFLFALMGFVKGPLLQDIPNMKFVTWIFPPVYSMVTLQTDPNTGLFSRGPFALTVAIAVIYATIFAIFNIYFTKKKGF